MAGVNKVIIIGHLGADPETRFFPDGSAVSNASVATSERWKDKQTGEPKEHTDWHRVVFRDRGNYRLGQIAGEYLKKGSKVYIEGKLRTRKYQDNNGQDRYITEVIAGEMQMLDSRRDSQDNQGQQGQQGQQYAPSQGTRAQAPAPDPSPDDFFDDDIPF